MKVEDLRRMRDEIDRAACPECGTLGGHWLCCSWLEYEREKPRTVRARVEGGPVLFEAYDR